MKQLQIQNDIVEKAINFYKKDRFGYLDVAMRVGKTKITLEILKKLYNYSPTILLCYPDNKIKDGWIDECKKWGYYNVNIEYVNFSSLHKYVTKIFDILVIDEFPSCSDRERDICHQIMTNDNKTLVLGLSGTVSRESKGEWGLKEIAKYTTNEGIEDGILSDYSITVHLVDLDDKIKTPNKKGKLKSEKDRYSDISWVISNKQRLKEDYFHLALARNRLSIKSISKMNYLRFLLSKMKYKRVIIFCGLSEVADNIGIPSYHSNSKNDQSFRDFQNKTINHLALAEIGRTGITFTELDSVIMLNTVYNQATMSQSINRAIKLDYPNKIADIHCIILNEDPEIKKIKEGLGMLDSKKIHYI